MNLTQGQFHQRPSWAETIWTWTIMVAILLPLAYLFATTLARELELDEQKMARHIEGVLYRSAPDYPPAAPTGVRVAEPKTRVFQDASVPQVSSGMGYDKRKRERSR